MKKVLKKTTAILLMLIAICIFIGLCQEFLFYHLDNNIVRIDGFYNEEKNSLDVILLGTSEVYAGYSAGLAYERYGFTSYPYVVDGNHASMIKSQVREISKTQSPDLIVIEVNQFLYADAKTLNNDVTVRRYIDSMPMSLNKLKTVAELDSGDKLSYIFPFIKYHSNWQKPKDMIKCVDNKLFSMGRTTLLKGMATFTGSFPDEGIPVDITDDKTELDLESSTEKHLVDFLEYCKKSGRDNILFVRFPHRIKQGESYDTFARSNALAKIVEDYGFDFYNFDLYAQQMSLDLNTDFYDDDHLNIYGQQKMTDFLGKFLTENYKITPSELSLKAQNSWNKSVDYTHRYFDYVDEHIRKGWQIWPYENRNLVEILEQKPAYIPRN